jgi:TPR repeat protein
MRILSCLLILCIFLSASCSKPINPAEKFYNKGRLAYSKKNYKEAFEYYKKAAELGDAKGMKNLARMYFLGEYAKENYSECFKWLKRSAELRDPDAMFILGLFHYYGWKPVIQDHGEAIKWFKQSAELGDDEAMMYLGSIYYVTQENNKAFKYYKKAAELGNAKAMYELGNMYYLGDGVLWKDPKKAKYWIKKAYEAGNKDAEKAWNSLALWSARL